MSIVTGVSGRQWSRPRIFFGWWVVFAAAAMNLYGSGVWFYGFPIFYKVLLDEFGWSAAAGAAVISLSRLEGGLEGPVIGYLVDRYGPRRLAILGAVIAGTGFLFMGQVRALDIGPVHLSAFVVFVLLYAGWMSLGYNTGFGHASIAAVNAWFIRKRSRAFALFSLGAGGSGFMVFALGWVVSNFGWRIAAFASGLGVFAIVIPFSLLLRHKPEQYGYLPDGDPSGTRSTSLGSGPTSVAIAKEPTSEGEEVRGPSSVKVQWAQYDFSVKEALLTLAFWMLILGTGARAIAMTSVVIHEVKYLTDVRGIPLVQASGALGAMVSISLVGRIGFGILADYVEKRYVLIITILFQALGIYILSTVNSMGQVWLFVVVYGIAYGGTIPVYMAIVGEYFGRQKYATIRGVMQFCLIPATVFGPVYAGWIYDTTNSYQIAFVSFIVALLLSTGFLFFARRPGLPASAGWVEGRP